MRLACGGSPECVIFLGDCDNRLDQVAQFQLAGLGRIIDAADGRFIYVGGIGARGNGGGRQGRD